MRRADHHRGFSLLELIVVLAILATIAGAVAPAFQRTLEPKELDSTKRQLTALLTRARRTSISLSLPVTVSIDVARSRYWVVVATPRGDSVIRVGTLSLAPGERLEATVQRAMIRFGPTGDVTLRDAVSLRGPTSAVTITATGWHGVRVTQ